ncbi:hypothetical protein T484DRAFT_1943241 [Baffinella frigidus]|nr:hypothetical protein T484DRAFT_1943241 [Cryptophyta sp. CCMP2293]
MSRRRQYQENVGNDTLIVEEPPYRAIFLAFFLFSVGTALLSVGFLVLFGHIDVAYWWPGRTWGEQATAFLVLGGISFIPGSYVTYVAWASHRGLPGYTYSMIPTHDH